MTPPRYAPGPLWLLAAVLPVGVLVLTPRATGGPGSLGALAILATPDRAAAVGIGGWCPDQRRTGVPALDGLPAVLATCPAGFQGWSSGSLLLRWSRRSTWVTLALRGPSEQNRRLLLALSGRLRLVPPAGSRP